MSEWIQVFSVICFVGGFWTYFLFNRTPKPRVLPPPRSRRTDLPFHETNSLAKLFTAVLAVKAGAVTWPAILKALNPENEPHLRTLLLELRMHSGVDPMAGLDAIETVCMAAKQNGRDPSCAELLEQALSALRKETSE